MKTMTRTVPAFVMLTLIATASAFTYAAEDASGTVELATLARGGGRTPEVVAITTTPQTQRPVGYSSNLRMGSAAPVPVLIVPSAQMPPEAIASVTEDMTIMSRILSNTVSQTLGATAQRGLLSAMYGSDVFIGWDSPKAEATYLEGYGALFSLWVNMPLTAPAHAQEPQEAQDKTDPVWEEARQGIYEPQERGRRRAARSSVSYDPEKVENLKTALIKALKHAANMRRLPGDESIVLTVTGSNGTEGPGALSPYGSYSRRRTGTVLPTKGDAEPSGTAPTVLVIRVAKSAIDAFAAGDLDSDAFRERVQLLTYTRAD